MPNWVRNEVSFWSDDDEKRKEILETLKSDESVVDFQKIIPMPEEYLEDQRWYDWRVKNWGTKWNAHEPYVSDGYMDFDTAWSTPEPIIKRLSEMFKDVDFSVRFADEDFGYNVGEYTYCNGKLVDEFMPEGGSYEAYDLAADILGYDMREDPDWECD